MRQIVRVLLAIALLDVGASHAASIALSWRPTTDSGIAGYNVYLRPARSSYAGPVDATLPTLQSDGTMSFVVAGLTASRTYYFAVTSYTSQRVESGLSNELPFGTVDPCIVDQCFSATSCQLSNGPDGTTCTGGVCRSGVCTSAPPPATGVCSREFTVEKPSLSISKLNTPPGDDKLKFQGDVVIPPPIFPPLDPEHSGMRLLIESAVGTPLVDVFVPAGSYDIYTKSGWQFFEHPSTWKYLNAGRGVPFPGGINRVIVKDVSGQIGNKVPGHLKLSVQGPAGDYVVEPRDLPIRARLVLTPQTPGSRACATATFPGRPLADCGFNPSGSTLKCR